MSKEEAEQVIRDAAVSAVNREHLTDEERGRIAYALGVTSS